MARLFDGVDDDIDINAGFEPVGSPKTLTICWWFKTDHNLQNVRILGPQDGDNDGIEISVGASGGTARPLFTVIMNNIARNVGGAGTPVPALNAWHFVVYQFNDGTSANVEYYLDDMDTAEDTLSGNLGAYEPASQLLHIGSFGDTTNVYDAELGPFMIFDGFFTANERKAAKIARFLKNPRLYYSMNGDNSSIEADLSGNGNNGTITGTTKTSHPPVGRYVPTPVYMPPLITAELPTFTPRMMTY